VGSLEHTDILRITTPRNPGTLNFCDDVAPRAAQRRASHSPRISLPYHLLQSAHDHRRELADPDRRQLPGWTDVRTSRFVPVLSFSIGYGWNSPRVELACSWRRTCHPEPSCRCPHATKRRPPYCWFRETGVYRRVVQNASLKGSRESDGWA
jgi:hypothetical protein